MATQKITVHVDQALLQRARRRTGKGVSDTIRQVSPWSLPAPPTRSCAPSGAASSSPWISGRSARTAPDRDRYQLVRRRLAGATGPDVEAVAVALGMHRPPSPVVLTELLSDPKVTAAPAWRTASSPSRAWIRDLPPASACRRVACHFA
jgi:hypothetical protein